MPTRDEAISAIGDSLVRLSEAALYEPEHAKEHAAYHDTIETLLRITADLVERVALLEECEDCVSERRKWLLKERQPAQFADMPSDFPPKRTPPLEPVTKGVTNGVLDLSRAVTVRECVELPVGWLDPGSQAAS